MSGPRPEEIRTRLLNIADKNNPSGCWLTTRYIMSNGYGKIFFKGKKELIHRVSAHVFLGFKLDSGFQVNHQPYCPNKHCFNPEHIYIGTALENGEDYSSSKTHCKRGHPTHIYRGIKHLKDGREFFYCKRCELENSRKYRRKNW